MGYNIPFLILIIYIIGNGGDDKLNRKTATHLDKKCLNYFIPFSGQQNKDGYRHKYNKIKKYNGEIS